MLCLQIITSQMFYDIISALHKNVTGGHGRKTHYSRYYNGITCMFQISIKNDNGSEVCSLVIVSEESVNIILCHTHFRISVFTLSRSPF